MYVHDNAFDVGSDYFGGASAGALRIKSDVSRGGEVHDVLYQNTCVNYGGNTLVFNPYYSAAAGSLIPYFHDITISNFLELNDSSHKSTIEGYNSNGIVYPLTLTLDNVIFNNATQSDYAAPAQVNNAQITLGPGPVNIRSFLQTDAAAASNNITIYNNVSNSDAPLDCSHAFVYLTGDLTAPTNTAVTGQPFTVTAMLQNVISPTMAGTILDPPQSMPSGGTIQLLEGTNVLASSVVNGGRLTGITIPSMTTGTHVYTAQYLGDSNYNLSTPLSFGFFTVTAAAPPPVADNQSVSVGYNAATPITLSATGIDTMAYSIVTNPAHGALSGIAPYVTYTPAPGYSGADCFTFQVNNGSASNVATVSITVANAPPVAASQSVTVAYNTATPITLSATGNGTLTYSVVTNPAHGTLSGTLPTLTYTPAVGFAGADSFTFTANNGTDSNVATVSITVLNVPPVATSQSVTVANNTATPIVLSATGNGTLLYSVVSSPAHGTLSGTAPALTYTPASGYAGADSFTFTANNGTDSNTATVSITVLNAAPVAADQSVKVASNTASPITLSATGSGTMTFSVITNPAHGTLSGTAPALTYTSASHYSGTDSFTFKANNGTDSNTATVSITVVECGNGGHGPNGNGCLEHRPADNGQRGNTAP
jgi:hypothetical protein